MNPLFNKQTRLHRSISAKVNPEEERQKFLKFHNDSLELHRDINLRPKGFEVPMVQSLLDAKIQAKIQDNKDSFSKHFPSSDNFLRPSSLSARQQLKSKLNPCNPFQSLTESSIRRNPENEKAMELILAYRKIGELENSVQTLNKEMAVVREQKFQLEKENGTRLAEMKGQVNELMKTNNQLIQKVRLLEEDNQRLKKELDTEKAVNASLINKKSQQSVDHCSNPSQKFKSLGQQFQRKINDLYQENYKLKNKLSWYEGKLQQSQTLATSLKQLNEMLEKRFVKEQQEDTSVKDKLQKENDRLREENLALREEKENVKSQYEMDLLKLENQIEELKHQLKQNHKIQKEKPKGTQNQILLSEITHHSSSYKKINRLQDLVESLQLALKDQVDQILRLKEKNKKLSKMLSLASH